jgi:hypothetical protein
MTPALRHSDPPWFLFVLSPKLSHVSIAPQLRIGFHTDAAFHAPGEAGSVKTCMVL